MNSTYSRIPIEFSESIEIPIDINWISNSKYNLNPTYQRMQANFVDGYYTPIDIERIESNFIYNGNFSIYPPSTWYSGSMPGSSASMLIFKWNPGDTLVIDRSPVIPSPVRATAPTSSGVGLNAVPYSS